MPGFSVGENVGEHQLSDKLNYYNKHCWRLNHILGKPVQPGSELLALYECSLPSYTINKETHTPSSLEYKFASSITWDDIKISWYDNNNLLDQIRNWRNSVWNPDCGIRMASSYKQNTEIITYTPDGIMEQKWTLYGSWPSSIKYGDLSYGSSDIRLVEVTLSYDYAIDTILR